MEDNLKRLTGAMKAFKREMYDSIHLYKELLGIVNEQNQADIEGFLSKVPSMTQDEIVREASILSGKKEGREYIFGLIENTTEK